VRLCGYRVVYKGLSESIIRARGAQSWPGKPQLERAMSTIDVIDVGTNLRFSKRGTFERRLPPRFSSSPRIPVFNVSGAALISSGSPAALSAHSCFCGQSGANSFVQKKQGPRVDVSLLIPHCVHLVHAVMSAARSMAAFSGHLIRRCCTTWRQSTAKASSEMQGKA
jgi:hypothetical protein